MDAVGAAVAVGVGGKYLQGPLPLQNILMQAHACAAQYQPVQIIGVVPHSFPQLCVGDVPGKVGIDVLLQPLHDILQFLAVLPCADDLE